MTGRRPHLAIVSLPFYRIARVSLAPPVLDALRGQGDVVIVAPFADEPGFRTDFAGPRTSFLRWDLTPLSRRERVLFAFSEIMRKNGYWRRYASDGMGYYVANQYTEFGDDGHDTRLGPARALMTWALSHLGRARGAWSAVAALMGTRWARFPQLEEQARGYDRVTLIQSANWGLQDRALAVLSRLRGWRNVLLPYTTDQLDMNGHLLNRFDAICLQGSYEHACARRFHDLPDESLERLGSVWLRHLELIKSSAPDSAPKGFILYAGVASTYYPRVSEFEAMDALLALASRLPEQPTVIYRPVESDPARRDEIRRRYENHPLCEIHWPGASMLGLEGGGSVPQAAALREYVASVAGCRLLVMSNTTSMGIDLAFLEKCGVIANVADGTGVLRRRHTYERNTSFYPGMRFVTSIAELIASAEYLLAHPVEAARESWQIVECWDYPAADFKGTLLRAVTGHA